MKKSIRPAACNKHLQDISTHIHKKGWWETRHCLQGVRNNLQPDHKTAFHLFMFINWREDVFNRVANPRFFQIQGPTPSLGPLEVMDSDSEKLHLGLSPYARRQSGALEPCFSMAMRETYGPDSYGLQTRKFSSWETKQEGVWDQAALYAYWET